MALTNPTPIQFGPPDRLPLFLIHDSGGTIFNYFLLKSLNRPVYGIHHTHFNSGERWDGGFRQMAIEYVNLMRSVVSSGKVLIGGTY
jgi:thioesterase domain-containing protein